MKPSTPAPISPVSRKLRSDSKLSALPPEAQSLLLQKLETQSYQETASWLQDTHGIRVSPSNLSTFRSRHLENQALKEAYLQSAIFNATLQELQQQNIDPGDAQVEAAVRRLFLFKVVNQGDIATYLHFTRVGNETKKLALTQAREERLQQQQQQQQVAHSASEVEGLFTSPDLASSPPLPPLSSLHPNPGPCAPRAQSIGAGTSRPRVVPPGSNHSKTPSPISPADSKSVAPNSEADTLASSPSNSLKYPQTPSIRSTAILLPDRPAPCPNRTGETEASLLSNSNQPMSKPSL